MALYVNVSQPMGGALNWSEGERLDELDGIFAELIRQINFIVSNLGPDNVIEAASVKAENIDTKNAKIVNAQIKNLTASKIQAGTLDLSKGITITNGGSKWVMTIAENGLSIEEWNEDKKEFITRFLLAPDEEGKFALLLCNKEEDATLALDDDGNAVFRGTVQSSEVYSSHIVGVEKETYDKYTNEDEGSGNGAFVEIGRTGLKVMQDMADGTRQQKIGMTSDGNGNPLLVIGSGAADGIPINGVVKPYGSMVLEKLFRESDNMHIGHIAMVGDYNQLDFTAGTINFNTRSVLMQGQQIATESYVDNAVADLQKKIKALEQRINSMGA